LSGLFDFLTQLNILGRLPKILAIQKELQVLVSVGFEHSHRT
jgi:hypothetical protein